MLRIALSLLVPPTCCACGASTGADVLCPACRRALPWLTGPRCPRCALPGRCARARCPAARAAFAAAWSPVAHAGPARELVVALKFRGALRVADTMAAQIAAGAPPALLAGGALVPVPSTTTQRLVRGFDHADCLARALGRRTGLDVHRCVRRAVGGGGRQLGAGRALRLAPGRVAMRATGPVPARAVLVDDVHTTGATLNACATALIQAGCCDVVALTYSRALG